MENEDARDAGCPFRVLPDTCVELFVNYADSGQIIVANNIAVKQPRSFIVSRMSNYMDVGGQKRSGCIAICFYPGAASHFFEISMNEVSNAMTDLHDLWKDKAMEMEERVGGAGDNDDRVNILQQYLLARLAKQWESNQLIGHWLWQVNYFKGQLTVEDLSVKLNISQRQLGRYFNTSVGLSPKEFINVTRFLHSLAHLKKYPSVSLTKVAYESGYYDQAHFIHEYKRFAGLTPGELLASRNILY